jgi:glycosyltransferase involved in cell wall biosynthesis
MLGDKAFRVSLEAAPTTDDRIFLVLGTIANHLFKTYVERARDSGLGIVSCVKSIVAMLGSTAFLSLPYFVSFMQQSSDSLIARDVRKAFGLHKPPRLVLVTDTFFEVSGVTVTIRKLLREASKRGIDLTVVSAIPSRHRSDLDDEARAWVEEGKLKLFPVVCSLDLPEYDGLEILFPPLLEMLRFLQEGGFTKMQISTPGTVGIAGLLCAKLLQIETSSTYHTSFPEYVESYTRDVALEALAWNYMTLFYHSVDEVVVPSKSIARLLHKRGLRNRKLLVLDRWTDVERFHPDKRDPSVWDRLGAPPAKTRFIYVGRLGSEKNLELLASAFRRVHERDHDVHLTLVGDGPMRRELESQLAGLPVTFTGFLDGEALCTTLASADVKVFPSTTDTWGNAPLEAQASGLPVIVTSVGGPRELMIEEHTGLVIGGHDVGELAEAMVRLLDPELRERFGANARAFAVRNVVTEPFTAILDADGYRDSLRRGEHPSRAVIALPPQGSEMVWEAA